MTASSPPPNSKPTVLVTGAAKRIGREIVLDLARNGYDVAVHFRSSASEANATVADAKMLGARAAAFSADLSNEVACHALVPEVAKHFRRLDAVINNASTFVYDDLRSFSYAAMDLHWRANTAPAIILAQALRDQLETQAETGCVVNLLDQKLWNPNPDYISYTLSKAALDAATTLLAQALAPKVRVCAVAPGVTLTSVDMSEQQFAHAQAQSLLTHSPRPSDIARAARFFLESPAITGTTLVVDGGQHLQTLSRDVLFLADSEVKK